MQKYQRDEKNNTDHFLSILQITNFNYEISFHVMSHAIKNLKLCLTCLNNIIKVFFQIKVLITLN